MKINRREFVGLTATGALGSISSAGSPPKIDRFALVSRHDPILHKFEPMSPLSVGNGEFAFTCDITGLQTFPELYKNAMPLCTMSQWGWHNTPLPEHLKGKTLPLTEYDTYGRKVGYMTGSDGQKELFDWLRENPHRLHLGQIGYDFGPDAKPEDITDIEQRLELWTGIIHSRFKYNGLDVYVRTAVHPDTDVLTVRVESELIRRHRLTIRLAFPYSSSSMQAADWNASGKHQTRIVRETDYSLFIARALDSDSYLVHVAWENGYAKRLSEHEFTLSNSEPTIAASFHFGGTPSRSVKEAFWSSEVYWKKFWTTGAVVDFSGSKDPRAAELERRVVLSQYLTAIQCSGSMPPQETGLTCNSWYGKFHLEMHWWHAAHFALWNRFPMLKRSLDWYAKILSSARERAEQQGYSGARWPKMASPDGRDSPSPIGPLLIWQQPHPIFYAELAYRHRPTRATLKQYYAIVQATAEFMASYAYFEVKNNRYVLGPPLIPAQENHPPRETWNPTFELEYWRFGLKMANEWRERIGLRRDPTWDHVIAKLSPLPVKDGAYLAHENCPQTFTERNKDHPSMLGALGVLRGEMVDRETMRRTLKKVITEWDWTETWGWDHPMVAMTAAKLGEPAIAIDALLFNGPKNHYLPNGHNYQRANLPLYLPGNGGLLYAVAMMTNGWKGAPRSVAPGFPSDGSWTIRSEGFCPSQFREI